MYGQMRWTGISVLAGLATLVGCASNADQVESRETAKEGLVVTSASVESGLQGTYTKDGRTIGFSAIRGERNPDEVLKAHPDAPEYAIDSLVADSKGVGFLVSGGGHGLEDSSWSPEDDVVEPTERTKDLAMVPDFLEELRDAELPEEVRLERDRLLELGSSVKDTELVVPPSDADASYACTAGYQHSMYIMRKAAFGVTPFDHTAIWLDSWYLSASCTWSYIGKQVSCNHGYCADALDASGVYILAQKCVWNSAMRSYSWPYFQRYNPYSYYGTGSCTTPYSIYSGSGNHNCNDDTYFEVYNIRNNAYYDPAVGPNNICIDSSSHYFAPDCVGNR